MSSADKHNQSMKWCVHGDHLKEHFDHKTSTPLVLYPTNVRGCFCSRAHAPMLAQASHHDPHLNTFISQASKHLYPIHASKQAPLLSQASKHLKQSSKRAPLHSYSPLIPNKFFQPSDSTPCSAAAVGGRDRHCNTAPAPRRARRWRRRRDGEH